MLYTLTGATHIISRDVVWRLLGSLARSLDRSIDQSPPQASHLSTHLLSPTLFWQWRPYSQLKSQLRELVPVDYKRECQCRTPNLSESDLAVKEDGVGSTIVATAAEGDKGKGTGQGKGKGT
jgi:hypothetical protein